MKRLYTSDIPSTREGKLKGGTVDVTPFLYESLRSQNHPEFSKISPRIPQTIQTKPVFMKTNRLSAISAAVVTGCALLSSVAHSQTVPPAGLTGQITAKDPVVLVGGYAQLDWKVNHPSIVKTVVTINPSEIIPLVDVYSDVRVIGQGVTRNTRSGYMFVPTRATMSINGSTFINIFNGINPDINPGKIISLNDVFGTTYATNVVQKGKAIRFGGQWKLGDTSGVHYKTNDGTDNVRFLVNGDTPPTNVPEYNAPSLESFLRPYLDTAGKVKIGPMDVIVFMELTHTAAQKSHPAYDLQDMVLLVTFRKR